MRSSTSKKWSVRTVNYRGCTARKTYVEVLEKQRKKPATPQPPRPMNTTQHPTGERSAPPGCGCAWKQYLCWRWWFHPHGVSWVGEGTVYQFPWTSQQRTAILGPDGLDGKILEQVKIFVSYRFKLFLFLSSPQASIVVFLHNFPASVTYFSEFNNISWYIVQHIRWKNHQNSLLGTYD